MDTVALLLLGLSYFALASQQVVNQLIHFVEAGLAYGWAWRTSGRITASAITHTPVNFI